MRMAVARNKIFVTQETLPFLEELRRAGRDYEVIIVDDGSADKTSLRTASHDCSANENDKRSFDSMGFVSLFVSSQKNVDWYF